MRWCRISRIGEINICLPWPRPHHMQENSGKRKLICTIVNSSAVNSSSQQRAREILCNNTSWSTQVLLAKLFPFNHLRLLTFPLQLEHIPKHFLTLRIFGTGPHLCSSWLSSRHLIRCCEDQLCLYCCLHQKWKMSDLLFTDSFTTFGVSGGRKASSGCYPLLSDTKHSKFALRENITKANSLLNKNATLHLGSSHQDLTRSTCYPELEERL